MVQQREYKDCFTNEILTRRFPSQFELVRYAIQIAQQAIHSGNLPNDQSGCQNLAYQVLSEIAENRDLTETGSKKAPRHEVILKEEIVEFENSVDLEELKESKKEKRAKAKK